VTVNLYTVLVRQVAFNASTNGKKELSERVLTIFIKLLKLTLKAIKIDTYDGEINKTNAQYIEAMKLVALFGNSAEARVAMLGYNDEDIVCANIELYILCLKLLMYLDEEHLPAQHALHFKQNVIRDCLFVLGAKITAEHSPLTVKKYLRLCSLLTSVLPLTEMSQLVAALSSLSGIMFMKLSNDSSLFGQHTILAARRQYILLIWDITKNVLSKIASSEHAILLSKIGKSAVSFTQQLPPKDLIKKYFELFQEQDDDLMTGLWHCLSVYILWHLQT